MVRAMILAPVRWWLRGLRSCLSSLVFVAFTLLVVVGIFMAASSAGP